VTAAQEITVREAARRAHRSPETVRRWIWSGRLPAIKRGNTYYVDVVHLEGLVVETDSFGYAGDTVQPGSLSTWLAELAQWRSGLAASGSSGAAETASDLVIEDRRARR
jgi:excisionase family DNA binding protein